MSEIDPIIGRLDRLEIRIDEVRAAMVQMAKTEERVSVILEQITTLFTKHTELQAQITKIEKENATQGQSIGFFERIGWIIAGAIGSLATWVITK